MVYGFRAKSPDLLVYNSEKLPVNRFSEKNEKKRENPEKTGSRDTEQRFPSRRRKPADINKEEGREGRPERLRPDGSKPLFK